MFIEMLNSMSQQLTLELSDESYADLQQKANAVGVSITEWIVAALSKQDISVDEVLHSAEHLEQARQRFRSHAGAISLGYPTGTDNESIDAPILVSVLLEEPQTESKMSDRSIKSKHDYS